LADGGLEEFSTHSGGGENSGTLTITEIQSDTTPYTMSGTFSFKAHQITGTSLTVTGGVFNDVPFAD
jgi:hypothetical protein